MGYVGRVWTCRPWVRPCYFMKQKIDVCTNKGEIILFHSDSSDWHTKRINLQKFWVMQNLWILIGLQSSITFYQIMAPKKCFWMSSVFLVAFSWWAQNGLICSECMLWMRARLVNLYSYSRNLNFAVYTISPKRFNQPTTLLPQFWPTSWKTPTHAFDQISTVRHVYLHRMTSQPALYDAVYCRWFVVGGGGILHR